MKVMRSFLKPDTVIQKFMIRYQKLFMKAMASVTLKQIIEK